MHKLNKLKSIVGSLDYTSAITVNLSSVRCVQGSCSAATALTRVSCSARGVNVNCVKLCSTRRSIDHDLGLSAFALCCACKRSWHFIIHARASFKARGNVNSKSLNLFWPIFAPPPEHQTKHRAAQSQEKRVENC